MNDFPKNDSDFSVNPVPDGAPPSGGKDAVRCEGSGRLDAQGASGRIRTAGRTDALCRAKDSVPAAESGAHEGAVPPSEQHPLEPFLPAGARLLMLGSFPPQRKRWSMDFFYPNLQNDMWRIVGWVFFGDKARFLDPSGRRFDRDRIAAFCASKGIALYDTAVKVIRLKDNASDNFLQVVREVDLAALLARIPACRAIVTTGQKATDTLRAVAGCGEPPVGGSVEFRYAGRTMRLYRMPSSSRAYPRPVEWKAGFYRAMFAETVGI